MGAFWWILEFSSTNLAWMRERELGPGLRADALHADLLRECLTRMEDFTTQELAIVTGLLESLRRLRFFLSLQYKEKIVISDKYPLRRPYFFGVDKFLDISFAILESSTIQPVRPESIRKHLKNKLLLISMHELYP